MAVTGQITMVVNDWHRQKEGHRGGYGATTSTGPCRPASGKRRWPSCAAQAGTGSYLSWGRRRGAWLGALLLDQVGILDDLRESYGERRPARLPLGEATRSADMTLLSEVADRWPALREHFGDRLLDRLTGDMLSQDSAAWDYLALVAARQPLLARELAQAVAAEPALLGRDGVLAWYSSTHRDEDDLLDILVSRLGGDGSNARALPSMLLAEPARRMRGDPADMHPRTYFPLAYAAVPPPRSWTCSHATSRGWPPGATPTSTRSSPAQSSAAFAATPAHGPSWRHRSRVGRRPILQLHYAPACWPPRIRLNSTSPKLWLCAARSRCSCPHQT